jgi:hypothetical protein
VETAACYTTVIGGLKKRGGDGELRARVVSSGGERWRGGDGWRVATGGERRGGEVAGWRKVTRRRNREGIPTYPKPVGVMAVVAWCHRRASSSGRELSNHDVIVSQRFSASTADSSVSQSSKRGGELRGAGEGDDGRRTTDEEPAQKTCYPLG